MAERAVWSGVISFGMVSIPVKLHTATRSKDISFNLLHESCGTKLQQKRWCPYHDQEVPWDEVVRGYPYAKGEYVTLTDEDFEKVPLPSRHTLEISAFVADAEIDPVFFEKTYYLAPDERGEKPYALLLQAMQDKQLVAVANITIRKKEQLCALRPHDGVIMLDTLYYADEVAAEPQVDVSGTKITKEELTMAHALVELLQKPFNPEEYRDRYRDAISEVIDAKLEGKEVVTPPASTETKVIDLAEALARSVAAAKKGKPATAAAKPKAKPKQPAPARRRTRSKTAGRKAG
ncbi:MAG: Ku protein [Gemmatimonadota bacterium]|nr:Ku protein [Gemmatimonadota bacterium]